MAPLGEPLTIHPIQTGWEIFIEQCPSWYFRCVDNPVHQFGSGSVVTRTQTRSDGLEPVLSLARIWAGSVVRSVFGCTGCLHEVPGRSYRGEYSGKSGRCGCRCCSCCWSCHRSRCSCLAWAAHQLYIVILWGVYYWWAYVWWVMLSRGRGRGCSGLIVHKHLA